jgi:hypothetical protein
MIAYADEKGFFDLENEMTLRDYFAAKAMQAIIGKADERSTTVEEVQLWVGHYAYTVADAMMEARNGTI